MVSLILGLNVVFPLLTYMAIGYGIKKINWISDKTIDEMNKLVFYVFLSVTLFLNAYNVEREVLQQKENLMLVALSLFVLAVIIIVANLVCNRANVTKARKAVLLQGTFRSNLALFGLAVNTSIYGEVNSGYIAILIAVLVPVYNIVSVFLFSNAHSDNSVSTSTNNKTISYKKVFVGVLKNPLVVASVLGIIFTLLNIQLPGLILGTLNGLSRVATPLAFVLLGAGIVFGNMAKNKKAIISTTFAKLIIVPLFAVGLALLLGYRGEPLVAVMCCFASPLAVASYTMAVEENVEPDLAGEIVAVSTCASVVTIFLFITGMSYFNLM